MDPRSSGRGFCACGRERPADGDRPVPGSSCSEVKAIPGEVDTTSPQDIAYKEKQFQAKWIPLRRRTLRTKKAIPGEVDTASPQDIAVYDLWLQIEKDGDRNMVGRALPAAYMLFHRCRDEMIGRLR